MSDPERTEEALALADELAEALDDPKRGDWGGYPWEHLGDAERDVRKLLCLRAALREAQDALHKTARRFTLAEEDLRLAQAENERLRVALASIAHHAFDVNRDAEYDLRTVKDIAAAAVLRAVL